MLNCFLLQQQVCTRKALEWNLRTPAEDLIGKFRNPSGFQPENIVTKPEMVGPVCCLEHFHFSHHVSRSPGMVHLTVNRLRTPVAMERTSAGRDHVHRKESVLLPPKRPVPL